MYQRILVPFDGSSTSELGLQEALKLAKLTGAKLRVVHAIEIMHHVSGFEPYAIFTQDALPRMRKAGEQILEHASLCAKAGGVAAETILLESLGTRVCDLVIEQAKLWNADLIVIGTHGRHGMRRLMLGSDAELILRNASVPVLLLRAPDAAPAPAAPA